MKDSAFTKVGIIVGILGITSSAMLKDWIAVCLWLVVILQDFRIIELEKRIDE